MLYSRHQSRDARPSRSSHGDTPTRPATIYHTSSTFIAKFIVPTTLCFLFFQFCFLHCAILPFLTTFSSSSCSIYLPLYKSPAPQVGYIYKVRVVYAMVLVQSFFFFFLNSVQFSFGFSKSDFSRESISIVYLKSQKSFVIFENSK